MVLRRPLFNLYIPEYIMKKFILLIISIYSQVIQSQEISTHTLFSPETEEHSDLHFLKEELEGKRLVMLGEMTHMYGNIFEMKARVIEYLHKELGYTTIAMESSMYDLWLMNSQHPEFNSEAFNEAVFSVWGDTKEFQRLVRYIAENDLKVMGFDSQIMDNIPDFIDGFFEFCREQDISIKLDEDDMGIAMEDVLEATDYTEDDIRFRDYEKELERIIKKMQDLKASDENYHWLQFTKSLLASSRDVFYSEEIPYKSDRADKNHNFRDKQMADNLLSYMARHPEEKVVVWADNIHVINDMSSVEDPILEKFVPMGSHISEVMGDKAYSLAVIHANDSLLESTTWHQTPVLKGSFEDRLVRLNQPYLFVSASQEVFEKPQQNRLMNYVHFSEARLDQLHDGYIFLKHATLPKKKTATTEPVVEQISSENTDEKSREETSNTFSFNGLVVDAETKEPVPFANIILEGQGIYRISDENGRFQLRIPEGISTEVLVSISALGYEPKALPVKKLNGSVALVQAFEQLDEVILTGYGTTPKKVMKRAIKEIEENYPDDPFNYRRYGRTVLVLNDTIHRDIEFVTKDYYEGYRQKYFPEQKVVQVKWNRQSDRVESEKYSTHLTTFRENPVQFSSLLHKRKYRKFDLEFVTSGKQEDVDLYVIKFSTSKTRFSFTNYWFPATYSGEIYINKEDFAVVKMVEKWESTLPEKDMEEYKYWHGEYKGDLKWTQDRISIFSQKQDGKYYATKFFERTYREKLNMEGVFVNTIYDRTFRLYDYGFEDLEVLDRDNWKRNAALDRVEYDETFWNTLKDEKSF